MRQRSIYGLMCVSMLMGCAEPSPETQKEKHLRDLSRIEAAAVERRNSSVPDYLGVETRLLEGDLVSFIVQMKGASENEDVASYAECAAAQYALIRGYGFARHVRTNVVEEGGLWRADAVYTISETLPQGQSTIDAEVTVSGCAETGIPTV